MDQPNIAAGEDFTPAPEEALFGGSFPVEQVEEPTETISLEEEAQGDATVSIVPEGEHRPPISGKTLDTRAAKVLFALGAEGPSREEVLARLQGGAEDSLRQSVASNEGLKARAVKEQVIREKAAAGTPLTPEDVAFMGNFARYEHKYNPETILEQKFAERYVTAVQGLNGGPDNPIGEAFRQNPEKLSKSMDFATEMVTRQEIIKNAIQDAQTAYDNQSWAGWGVDQLKGLIPFYGSLKVGYGSPGNESYLEGSVIADMVRYYWGLPVDKMAETFRKDISGIAKDNPTYARRMAEAMLTYTKDQAFLDNAFDTFNIATAPGVGTAGRLVRRGATAATEALGALRGSAEAATGSAGRVVAREAAPAASEAPRAVAAASNAVPPVKEGYVRFYHGHNEGVSPTSGGGRWVTTDPEYARNFRTVDRPNNVSYVDLPKDHPEVIKAKAWDDVGDKDNPMAWNRYHHFETSEDVAKGFKLYKESEGPRKASFDSIEEMEKAAGRETPAGSETLKAVVRANADETPDLPKMLNDLGDTKKASELYAQPSALAVIKGEDRTGVLTDIASHVPDFLRPDAFARGSKTLSTERSLRLAQVIEANSTDVAKAFMERVKVGRAPEEVVTEILSEYSERLRREVSQNANVQDAIVAVQRIPAWEAAENVSSARVIIGQTDKSLFESRSQAANAAVNKYRLPAGSFKITEEATGFAITIEKHLDETAEGFRMKINTEANRVEPSLAGTFLGFMRSADDRVPKFQVGNRLAAVHGRSKLESVFRSMRDEIGIMTQKHTDEVSDVMKLDKIEVDPQWVPKHPDERPPRGVFRETIGEFEETFYSIHKRFPTEQQTTAYFMARRLNDWDYVIRNAGAFRDHARMGYGTIKIRDLVIDETTKRSYERNKEFIGKTIDSLPWNSDKQAGILIHNAGQDPIRVPLLGATPTQKAEIDRLMKEGYKIVKVENPVRVPFEEKFGRDPVHFIVTKDYLQRSLDPTQIPYRKGWHTEYDYDWYIKQPTIREAGGQTIPESDDFVTLYRFEGKPSGQKAKISDWVAESTVYKNTQKAAGRWFTDDLEEAKWYEREHPGGRVVSIRVPKSEAEQYRVSNMQPKGTKDTPDNPVAFSARPEKEFYVPEEWAAKRAEYAGPLRAPKRNIYEGDKTFTGHTSRAEAKLLAENLEKARQMLVAGDKSLDNFVEANLPYTGREFRRLFIHEGPGDTTPPPFDLRSPFFAVENGRTVSDDFGKQLSQQFENFEDMIRSPHNDFANNVDKKFQGQRNDPLKTIKEGEPHMKLTEADEVDPFMSLQSTMRNITRHTSLNDLKISHTEGWINQFGHLIDAPLEDVRANPIWYLHHGAIKESAGSKDIVAAAKHSKAALLELLGTKGDFDLMVDALKMKLIDGIYESGGQAAATKARNFLTHREKDPFTIMRNAAFHTNIGMFNPYQLVQNAMTMTHAIAIAGPVNGFSGAAAMVPMRYALMNENALDKFARISTGFGWRPEWFKEAFKEFKRSGRNIIEGEHGWKDDLAEVSLTKTRFGNFLDAGLTFFKEGERLTRLAAYNMAYLEWRKANPTAAMDDAIRRQVMARSDLMTANMTRASNAAYQQGIWAIPTQFTSYWTRLSEQMLGKRLTGWEKARIMGLNSMLYGVPIGVTGAAGLGALTGGQIPWHENIREAMMSRGVDMNRWDVDAFNSGTTGMIGRLITGEPNTVNEKVSPGGGSLLKDVVFGDKKFIEAVFGASGQKVGMIWESLDPFIKKAMSPFRADDRDFPLRGEDALQVIRNVKSIDSGLAVIYAHNYGKAFARNSQSMVDMNTTQAIFQLATGGQPRNAGDLYLMADANKDRKELVRKVTEIVARDGDAYAKALIEGNESAINDYGRRMATHMNLAELTMKERAAVWQAISNKHKDRFNQVRYDYYIRNAPANRAGDRSDYFMGLGNK